MYTIIPDPPGSAALSTMPTFSSRPLNQSPLLSTLRNHPFGFPFLSLVIFSSFALQIFTRTRYDLHSQRVTSVSKEQELGMNAKRKRVDIREEYYVSPSCPAPLRVK